MMQDFCHLFLIAVAWSSDYSVYVIAHHCLDFGGNTLVLVPQQVSSSKQYILNFSVYISWEN